MSKILENHPELPNACEDVLALLKQRHKHRIKPNLQFYNACFHVLAKCSPYHKVVPVTAETLFQDMSSITTPDTASFVSLMHAWTCSQLLGSANQAQANLDQIVELVPADLSEVCFNVCILVF
jgi:hypothetical protein